MALVTSDMVKEFDEVGFVRIAQAFSPQEMDRIDEAFERLYALSQEVAQQPREGANAQHAGSRFTYGQDSNHVRHIAYCGNAEPVLMEVGRDPRLLEIAARLLDSKEMDHLINQAHYKRPGSGVVFDWHQDSMHRGIDRGGFVDVNGRGSYVQILLAVDASTAENGPLEFIPGSSKLGHLGEDPGSKVDLSARVAPELQRGDIVAFGPYTLHGSQANRSDRSRRVFINGFAYPGANQRSYHLPRSGERLTWEGQLTA